MQDTPVQIGSICLSKSGRDSGRYMAVVGIIDDQFVYIADGTLRKLSNPKKKKLKHLHIKPIVLDGIAQKLNTGMKVFDAELKNAINAALQPVQKED